MFSKMEVRDHPRVCGEHYYLYIAPRIEQGSSPRMRGTPSFSWEQCVRAGIIPAYAGNTHIHVPTPIRPRDHPRVCGEHSVNRMGFIMTTGSSPRMRGTRIVVHLFTAGPGIIPAYAGNTYENGWTVVKYRDHPRVCGEHAHQYPYPAFGWGSSPRMRGTLTPIVIAHVAHGIIPAYAGNTVCLPLYSPWLRDHPRVCGEHLRGAVGVWWLSGIIPAYAGNTKLIGSPRTLKRDHPRVCGEHCHIDSFLFS